MTDALTVSRPQPALIPGDILLTVNRKPWGRFNSVAQAFKRRHALTAAFWRRGFWPTHVAMMLDNSTIIHATKGQEHGVLLDNLDSLIRDVHPDQLLALRHPEVAARHGDPLSLTLTNAALYYFRQRYKLAPDRPVVYDTSFCSELVYKILRDLGVALPAVEPRSVFPFDFLLWADRLGWTLIDGPTVFAWRRLARPETPSLAPLVTASLQQSSVQMLTQARQMESLLTLGAESLLLALEIVDSGLLAPRKGPIANPEHRIKGEIVLNSALYLANGPTQAAPDADAAGAHFRSWELANIPKRSDAPEIFRRFEVTLHTKFVELAGRVPQAFVHHLNTWLTASRTLAESGEAERDSLSAETDRPIAYCLDCLDLIDLSEPAASLRDRLDRIAAAIDTLIERASEHAETVHRRLQPYRNQPEALALAVDSVQTDVSAALRALGGVDPLLQCELFEFLRLMLSHLGDQEAVMRFFQHGPRVNPRGFIPLAEHWITLPETRQATIEAVRRFEALLMPLQRSTVPRDPPGSHDSVSRAL